LPTITVDDVTEFQAVLAQFEDLRGELDDLTERMRRKGDLDRVTLLRRASSALADVRRSVDNAL
jgi:hypothetical protein